MAEPPQKVTPLLLDVLEVLLDNPDGAHGYAIVQALRVRPDRPKSYNPGTVYPVLANLLSAGWAHEKWDWSAVPARRIVRLNMTGTSKAQTLVTYRRHQPNALAS